MRILIVEDKTELRESLEEGLRLSGYAVDSAENGEAGWELLQVNDYDLLLLDLNLPLMDGMEILRRIRLENQNLRVLILSARDGIDSRVAGLDSGANDYLVKPFRFAELLTRIRSLLRRKFETQENMLHCQNICLDWAAKQVLLKGRAVRLMPKEYGILEYLMCNADRYVSQEELLEHVWDEHADPFTASVRVYVSYLRKKLSEAGAAPDLIESAPGKGYRVREEAGQT